ncbi:MAG: His/Gly/Thr/Pro-type tRNA ligase C-terminal domain-containing protein, partial [bacterium]|nr:His/Gly/Thr/Pro-type tRNA ligase C-terminal domain-containing protein [bacterium]
NGLIIPPKLAPIQVIIIPIFQRKKIDEELEKTLEKLKNILENFRIEIDTRKEYSVGWKFNDWELKGVPLRIEMGQREIKENRVTLVRRDSGEKYNIPFASLVPEVSKILNLIQRNLFEKSSQHLKENTTEVSNYNEFKDIMKTKKGFLKAFWCENPKCEAKIKKETKATIRVLPLNGAKENGKCIYCGKPAKNKWFFAQA